MPDFKALAQQAANEIGVPWEWVYAQWQFESGDFTSWFANNYNNYGGIKGTAAMHTGYNDMIIFDTPDDYANYYGRYVSKYYPDAKSATNVNEYLQALENGGYFVPSDNENNKYYNGVGDYLKQLGDTISANPVYNNIAQLNKTPTKTTTTSTTDKSYKEILLDYPKKLLETFSNVGTRVLYTLVGLSLLIGGIFLLSKDNTMILEKKDGE